MIRNCTDSRVNFTSSNYIVKFEKLLVNDVMDRVSTKCKGGLNLSIFNSPGTVIFNGTKHVFDDKSMFKDVQQYIFNINDKSGIDQIFNATTVKKIFGFYQIKDGFEGKNILTRNKEKFVESLTNLISNRLKP